MKFSDITRKIRNFLPLLPTQRLKNAHDGLIPIPTKTTIRIAAPGQVEASIPNTAKAELNARTADDRHKSYSEEALQQRTEHQTATDFKAEPKRTMNWSLPIDRERREWDGKSVRDIVIKPSTRVHIDLTMDASVPPELRDLPVQLVPEFRRTLEAWQQGIEIHAIDPKGEVLVGNYTWSKHGDFSADYRVVGVKEAITHYEQYRGTPVSEGTIKALNSSLERPLSEREAQAERIEPEGAPRRQVEAALPGQSYRGQMTRIDGNTVYQDINATTSVAHDVRALVGSDVIQLLGKAAEIRYPHGEVGLVAPIGGMSRHISSAELTVAQRDIGESERSDMER